MDSRFSHLRQRDTSVSMLRVKMSRRRSQSQKENRERVVNTRRQLDKLPELDVSSLEASLSVANIHMNTRNNNTKSAKEKALEERLKQLERWKERKALEKEKEKRERERKGVFKTGLYHSNDKMVPLPPVPAASSRAKEVKMSMAPPTSSRVTRSMKQQQMQKPLRTQNPNTAAKKAPAPSVERATRSRLAPVKAAPALSQSNVCAVEPVVRATRSVAKPPLPVGPVVKDRAADVRSTRSRAVVNPVAPSSGRRRNCKANVKESVVQPAVPEECEEETCPPSSTAGPAGDNMVVDQAPAVDPDEQPSSSPSFAPEGFVFHAPAGLSSIKFDPLTPRSADAFLTPSSSFNLPPAPMFIDEPGEPSPPKSQSSAPSAVTASPSSSLESKHDVAYFRSEIATETERLTSLSAQWESKVEDESIPEEMRDSMRTAVGQARLLMKERFKQFSGLVDDCELHRGEKVTTCSDLQGFWDMVYYQVEDVNKKFNALRDAEARGWVEEHKPPPRQRKAVKKPPVAPAKPAATKATAKSRLAAAKAAMKARQQAAEAENAVRAAGDAAEEPGPSSGDRCSPSAARLTDTVALDGGVLQVECPTKAPGSVRRSSRLSAAVLPQASPSASCLSPRRVTRRSLAVAHTPVQTPVQPSHSPALHLKHTPRNTPKCVTPQPSQNRVVSLCSSAVQELPSDTTQTDVGTRVPEHSAPSICVVQEEDEPADGIRDDPPLSPCRSPSLLVAAEVPSGLSFTLSPTASPHQLRLSSSAVMCSPSVPSLMKAQKSVCDTPDSSVVEEIPGLDFERYLQPSQRCSLSPETVAIETTLSPMAVEMESPRGQQEAAPAAASSAFTLQSPQAQTAQSSLLLFTPNPKDRIRQSACPTDLMVFTPPL